MQACPAFDRPRGGPLSSSPSLRGSSLRVEDRPLRGEQQSRGARPEWAGERERVVSSALVFFSGLSMSVTPGKVGELLKSFLLKQADGTPVGVSAPVVVGERLTDLLSLLVLAVFGVAGSGYGWDILAAAAVLCGLVIVLALWRRAGDAAFRLLARLPFMKVRRESFQEMQRTLLTMVGWRCLVVGTAISAVAWFAECAAFWLVLRGTGIDFPIASAMFVYALGTIAGAVTMLPGGLVATEASMVFVLVELFRQATRPAAVTAVLVVRICTLWFAVLVGVVALALFRRRFGTGRPSSR
ncbi:MAG: flippase-like domain-containing protein [Deltaproteobacteria bacterium]|nr:flippase-like domain-containing protein [Deltaproteobacteria bacterium]